MDIKKAIRALLQSDFGGVQLSAARVDELAKRLDGKVENEDQVKEKLSVLNDLLPFSDIAKEDDRQRSLNSELEKLKKGAGKSEEKVEGGAGEAAGAGAGSGTEDVPAWAKAIIEGNRAVTEKLAALEGQKVVNDRKSLIQAKLKDADEAYSAKVVRDFGRMSFADDAAFEEYLADVEADYASHVQTTAESKLGNDAPFKGIGKDGKVAEATKEELDSVMNEIGL
ncbi:hypothetical protein K7A41_23485 [Sphingobacterium sp. InxBP1]|uniref:hypothetical protein n=1 Tax=Sphingobacterium sp. InxBP1 TaxID=2870328 RepID=UPI002243DD1D|nr:hypothetical protein [Sphingobacterium sp. InxBP1]MCW8314208.1 hypothetical protein [Sphingobacterium sp. InxBP1]